MGANFLNLKKYQKKNTKTAHQTSSRITRKLHGAENLDSLEETVLKDQPLQKTSSQTQPRTSGLLCGDLKKADPLNDEQLLFADFANSFVLPYRGLKHHPRHPLEWHRYSNVSSQLLSIYFAINS